MTDETATMERELERLARAVTYPPAPLLAAEVRRRLAEAPERRPRYWVLPQARWALAAAGATALVLALVLGAWAPGREAVADFFDRIRIFRTEESPAGLPKDIVGTPVAEAELERKVGFALRRPAYPAGLELRDVLLQEFGNFRAAVLFYGRPGEPGFALFETVGAVGKGLPVEPGLTPAAGATPVAGLGQEAFWLVGLRIVQYYDESGGLIERSQRATDTNTLVWTEDGLLFRLEGALSLDEALRIARSLR